MVRTVQPVLRDWDTEYDHAALSLSANRWTVFRRVIQKSPGVDQLLFHARTANAGDAAAASPADAGGVTFVRPHDIEIRRENSDGSGIAARINHIAFAGSLVNVELARIDDEAVVDAALSAHDYKDLQLKPDDKVFIRLRNTRSFDEDYSI